MYKTKYALLYHSLTYINVYIGIRSECTLNSKFNKTTFIKALLAQSVEHLATNLKVVGTSTTVSKNISFCFCRFRSESGRFAGPIQMKSIMTVFRGKGE